MKKPCTSLYSPAHDIAISIKDKMHNGSYALGEKLPTERQLAEQFSSSRGTIRKALYILEEKRLIVRHQGRGTFAANPIIARFKSPLATLIGILVFEREYFFEAVINAASAEASKNGYTLATGTNNTPEMESEHIEAFVKNKLRGVIITPRNIESINSYDRLIDKKIPVVFLDTKIKGCQEDYVGINNKLGIYLAVKHLTELGHRKIAYIGHNSLIDYPIRSERSKGYIEACKEFSLNVPDRWLIEIDEQNCTDAIIDILKEKVRPAAFVCYNDNWAIKTIQAAQSVGFKTPDDISVIGFDDSILASSFKVPITSVSCEKEEMGRTAIEFLIGKIESKNERPKREVLINPTLKIRQSTLGI